MMNQRVIKFLVKGLISTIMVCRSMGLSQEPETSPINGIKLGIGAFIEGEQERISPAYGRPYKAYGMAYSGVKVEATTPLRPGKIKNFFFGNTTFEGYVGKLASQCTIKQQITFSNGPDRLLSVQSDHSLGVKVRVTKVVLHHKGLKIKLRGEGMYGLGGITSSGTSLYPKGTIAHHEPLKILKIKHKGTDISSLEGGETLKDYACLPDTLLILKRAKFDAVLENEITSAWVSSVGIYSRWGIWRIGREEIFFNVGKEYCFKDSLGTCFTLTYKLSPFAYVCGEINLGKAQAASLSFQYMFGG